MILKDNTNQRPSLNALIEKKSTIPVSNLSIKVLNTRQSESFDQVSNPIKKYLVTQMAIVSKSIST